MDLTDPVQTALLAADALERGGIRCALFGGLALGVYGDVRETADADFAVADAGAAEAQACLRAAGVNCVVAFSDVAFGGLRLARLSLLPGGGNEGLNVVDLVRPASGRYAEAALGRILRGPLRGREIPIVAASDFVIFKVLADRDRDLDDAASVLLRSPDLVDADAVGAEVRALASEIPGHDVVARWAEVRRRAGSPA